jgi:hypothetical protein
VHPASNLYSILFNLTSGINMESELTFPRVISNELNKTMGKFLYLCGGGEGDANFDGAVVRVVRRDHAVLGRDHLRLAFLHANADHISYVDPAMADI